MAPSEGMVSVVFTKWGDRPHWHFECRRLGEDAFGVWLSGVPGTRLQRAGEPPVESRNGFVQLVPHRGDWIAFFNLDDWCDVYVDVTTAPRWDGRSVTCVDLDLDVIRRRDGRVELLDEDEFQEHRARYGYPAPVVQRARATADWLLDAVRAGREPFGSTGASWLSTQPWASGQAR